MTDQEQELLNLLEDGLISRGDFLKAFPIDLTENFSYIEGEIINALKEQDYWRTQTMIELIWFLTDQSKALGLLNNLLVDARHHSHQIVARMLQEIKSPSTVPFVVKALKTDLDYLDYTFSEKAVVAKWFSWILASIGTESAINLIRHYTEAGHEAIRSEMSYRLKKI